MIQNTFEEQILMGRLPSSPGVGRLLVELVRKKQLTSEEVAAVIAVDPALAGRTLQAAQSLAPSADKAFDTVLGAVESLGQTAHPRALRNLTMVAPGHSTWCAGFDYENYWAVALARAVSAESISRSTGRSSPEAIYTLALLADVGRLALATVYPSEYSALLVETRTLGIEKICDLERARFRIDHNEVSACLLEHWGLPKTSSRALLLHETTEESEQTIDVKTLELASILRCAKLAAESHVDTLKGYDTDRSHVLLQHLREEMNLTEAGARKVRAEIQRALVEKGVLPRFAAEPEPASTAEPEPVEPLRRSPLPNGAEPGSTGTERGLRILAVDDDPTSLQILRRTLVNAGHTVQIASNGADALQIALESSPEAIVADWMMPRMDGVELCRALRCIQTGRETYFLLLTGRDQEEQIVAAYDAGVDDYVTKPFNARILLARLRPGQRMSELREHLEAERQVAADQVRQLSDLNRQLNTASKTDYLTGLPNRRHVCDRLAEEWTASTRGSTPVSVMMIDIDRFKRINDEHGHEVGDIVLTEVAQVLRSHARQGEIVARIGGEEFLVVCPNTSQEQASTGADRLRKAVESHVIRLPSFQTGATVSIGVAERTPSMATLDALLKTADEAVYAAKSSGRNQVRLAPAPIAQGPGSQGSADRALSA